MATLTIYTPTYNRAHLLHRVYKSLCRQTNKDFIWLIVDDGSTDNTKEIVDDWIAAGILTIRYLFKENGGVHTARDLAYRICDTELIVSCDSDDWLTDDAVENWLSCWKQRNSDDYIGIISVAIDPDGNRISSVFPDVSALSYQDFTYKYKCIKEKQTLLRTDIIASLPPSPVFPGERLVGEGYKWIQLPIDRKFILLNKPTRVYEQQRDGYVMGSAISRFNNPNGFRAAYCQNIISAQYFYPRLKGHLGYIAFSMILKDKGFIRCSPKPAITTALLPFGAIVYWRFLLQKRRAEKNNSDRIVIDD